VLGHNKKRAPPQIRYNGSDETNILNEVNAL